MASENYQSDGTGNNPKEVHQSTQEVYWRCPYIELGCNAKHAIVLMDSHRYTRKSNHCASAKHKSFTAAEVLAKSGSDQFSKPIASSEQQSSMSSHHVPRLPEQVQASVDSEEFQPLFVESDATSMNSDSRWQEPFAHVVSLGSRCFMARILRDLRLRKYAGPFDWIYTNGEMVSHCLKDRFNTFMDIDELHEAGQAWGHRTYGAMMNRKVVFPHHRPGTDDRLHFQRSVERLLKILHAPERKLFILGHLEKKWSGSLCPSVEPSAERCKSKKQDLSLTVEHRKRPLNGFLIFRSEQRESISQELGRSRMADVTKVAAERWKALAALEKEPFEKKALEEKAKHEKMMANLKAQGGEASERPIEIESETKSLPQETEEKKRTSQSSHGHGGRKEKRTDFSDLFQCLKEFGVNNFELQIVHVKEGSGSSAETNGPLENNGDANERVEAQHPNKKLIHDTGPGLQRLIVHELQCVGSCTGIYFKNDEDERALRELVICSSCDSRRPFRLKPDPLPQDAQQSVQGRYRPMSMDSLAIEAQQLLPCKRTPSITSHKSSAVAKRRRSAIADEKIEGELPKELIPSASSNDLGIADDESRFSSSNEDGARAPANSEVPHEPTHRLHGVIGEDVKSTLFAPVFGVGGADVNIEDDDRVLEAMEEYNAGRDGLGGDGDVDMRNFWSCLQTRVKKASRRKSLLCMQI